MSAGPETPGAATAPTRTLPAARRLTARLVDRLDSLAGEIAADHRPATRPLVVGAGEGVLAERLQARFGTCVVHAGALRLPFPDQAFDLVVCVDVGGHVPGRLDDPAAGLRELVRVTSRHLLLSVPRAPFALRARRRWTGAGFQRFVSTEANVRAVASTGPWTSVWATRV